MLGSSALPTFPVDVRSGRGVRVTRKNTTYRFDLEDKPLPSSGSGATFSVKTEDGNTALADGQMFSIQADRDFIGDALLVVDENLPRPWLDANGIKLARIVAGRVYRTSYDARLASFRTDSLALVDNDVLGPMAPATLKGNAGTGTAAPSDLTPGQVRSVLTLDRVDNTSDAQKAASGPIAEAVDARLAKTGNLGDLQDVGAARVNLGLKETATLTLAEIAATGAVAEAVNTRAPKASPQFTGGASVDGSPVVTDGSLPTRTVASTSGQARPLRDWLDTVGNLQSGVQTGSLAYDTLAQLNANLAPANGATAQVVADGANNGFYAKNGASGGGTWVRKSTATVPGLDGRTTTLETRTAGIVGRFAVEADGRLSSDALDSSTGTGRGFHVADGDGFDGLSVEGDAFQLPGTLGRAGPEPSLVADGHGFAVSGQARRGLLVPGGRAEASPLPGVMWGVQDEHGFVGSYVDTAGRFYGPGDLPAGFAFTPEDVAARNARSLALSERVRSQAIVNISPLGFGLNHLIGYGQSLMQAKEAWGGTLLAPARNDILMIGQSVRPNGSYDADFVPVGDSTVRPMAATVQADAGGAPLSPSAVAALPAGDGSLGETPMESAALFLRILAENARPLDPGTLLVSNAAVSGQTIESLSKGAGLYNRLTAAANLGKAAAAARSASYGIPAIVFDQGEYNNVPDFGGTTDKAAYKAAVLQLMADIRSDLATAIAGQSRSPVCVTYQTGAQFARDATAHAVPMAQLEIAREDERFILSHPSYCTTDKEGGHLDLMGSRWSGLYHGKALYETLVLRRRWLPTHMTRATLRARSLLVEFHVPYAPLQIRPAVVAGALKTYAGWGLSVTDSAGKVPIASIALASDTSIAIGLGRKTTGAVTIWTGRQDDDGHTNICDSDPTVAPLNYTYTAGTGQYSSANIAQFVNKPFQLFNWATLQSLVALQS